MKDNHIANDSISSVQKFFNNNLSITPATEDSHKSTLRQNLQNSGAMKMLLKKSEKVLPFGHTSPQKKC